LRCTVRLTGPGWGLVVVEVEMQIDWDESVSVVAVVDVLDVRWVRRATDGSAHVRSHRVHHSVDCYTSHLYITHTPLSLNPGLNTTPRKDGHLLHVNLGLLDHCFGARKLGGAGGVNPSRRPATTMGAHRIFFRGGQ